MNLADEDDFYKLSPYIQSKVQELCANNWTNIKVFIRNDDPRDPLRKRIPYAALEIQFKMNGRYFRTFVSAQDGGHLTKAAKKIFDKPIPDAGT